MKNKIITRNTTEQLTLLLIFTLLFIIAYFSLSDSFLWYDEAGQFYISKGLNHDSEPYSNYLGLREVLYNNRYYNMDPGGFSIILHFWSMISNHYVWLQTLPLFFYCIFILYLYKIGTLYLQDRVSSLFLASIFMLFSPFIAMAGELRAYSMEMAGIAVSIYYLLLWQTCLTFKKLFLLSLVLVVFMTSRYGFIIYAFCFSIYIAIYHISHVKNIEGIRNILCYSLPLITTVAVIYLGAMRYQNSSASQIWYVEYIGSNLSMLHSVMALRFYAVLAIIAYQWKQNKRLDTICAITLIVNIVFFILSFVNLYPWDNQRTMSATVTQYLMISLFLLKHGKRYYAVPLFIIFMLIKGAYIVSASKTYFAPGFEYSKEKIMYNEYTNIGDSIDKSDKIFINIMLCPTIRYQYEEAFPELAKKYHYPDNFIFAGGSGNPFPYDNTKVVHSINYKDTNCKYYIMLEGVYDSLEQEKTYKHIFLKKK